MGAPSQTILPGIAEEVLAKAGVTLLHNSARTVRLCDRDFRLVGLGDVWAGEMQPMIAFATPDPSADATIVLSHNPDTKDYTALDEYLGGNLIGRVQANPDGIVTNTFDPSGRQIAKVKVL